MRSDKFIFLHERTMDVEAPNPVMYRFSPVNRQISKCVLKGFLDSTNKRPRSLALHLGVSRIGLLWLKPSWRSKVNFSHCKPWKKISLLVWMFSFQFWNFCTHSLIRKGRKGEEGELVLYLKFTSIRINAICLFVYNICLQTMGFGTFLFNLGIISPKYEEGVSFNLFKA